MPLGLSCGRPSRSSMPARQPFRARSARSPMVGGTPTRSRSRRPLCGRRSGGLSADSPCPKAFTRAAGRLPPAEDTREALDVAAGASDHAAASAASTPVCSTRFAAGVLRDQGKNPLRASTASRAPTGCSALAPPRVPRPAAALAADVGSARDTAAVRLRPTPRSPPTSSRRDGAAAAAHPPRRGLLEALLASSGARVGASAGCACSITARSTGAARQRTCTAWWRLPPDRFARVCW